ncbi:hypothetical protein EG68_03972 [Paragonimus skrjabini miyazakii]|uniref:LIM zinc-binding domain-containing protein n=1 Tax=Paragonimus skrjabini miyazakii TaxID=59628 RepID=A0A8S9Z139_9TREM|nr:hypothetical protein EG68_03972 [Paragonimus skrjabini miyazakii]
MPFVPPKSEKCVRCSKPVYANERIEAGDKVWHRLCFRCSVCGMSLNLNNYNQSDQILYCKKHYQDNVLAKNTQTPI